MKKYILSILVIAFSSSTLFAQWTKGKGKGYYKLSAWYLESDKHYETDGTIRDNVNRKQFNVNVYAEYGVTNNLDIIGYIPFFARVAQDNQVSGTTGAVLQKGEGLSSIGDIDLGVRYGIFKKGKWAMDAKLLLGLPTGNNKGGSDGSYQTGDGEFNQFLSTSLGYSTNFGDLPFYAKSYVGFNNRTKGFSDEFRGGVEAGINLFNNKLWIISRLNILKSFKNGTLNAANANGSIFANNIEFTSFGFEAAYYITNKLGVSASFDSAFSGRVIAANPSFSGGIFLDIK
ncbi:hypothetical protein WH52_05770 [Tenacibaculum holothuriorum]|uniref:Transporter n=1 Tax=Tenacibaculum holothuriorum TaxID=1635173 RepID=A0A1Y2PDN5_9FLAO|nr:hypothetical protein [Tenacibaculum holothuriorum]OSY88280.1 hypothetical protein WH52_05770 [Tenacibaculum holothuriorum]